ELGIVSGVGFVGNLALHALPHGEELSRGDLRIDPAEQAGLEHLARGALEEALVAGDGAGAQERLALPEARLASVVGGERLEGDDQRSGAAAGPQPRVDPVEA